MNVFIYKVFGIGIFMLSFLTCTPLFASSEVINHISVSSNSGGNTSKGGVIIEGSAKSTVDIVTKINGEIVEEIHEESTDEPITIEHQVISNNEQGTATTHSIENEFVGVTQVRRTDETTQNMSSNIITNSEKEIEQFEKENNYVFFKLFTHFSRTINYVLSKLI